MVSHCACPTRGFCQLESRTDFSNCRSLIACSECGGDALSFSASQVSEGNVGHGLKESMNFLRHLQQRIDIAVNRK